MYGENCWSGLERQNRIAYVNEVKKNYDTVLIDCMPSLGMITINALAAADSVIIPVQAHYLPAKGMTQLMRTIGKVKRQINPSLKVDGVLLTLVDGRTNLAKQTAETLRQSYGSVLKIYRSEIPVAIKAAEISAVGKSIYAYDNGSEGIQRIIYGVRVQLYTGQAVRCSLAEDFLWKVDDCQHTCSCFQSSQGTLRYPCAVRRPLPFCRLCLE